jgi:hypothetical protein
MSPLDAHPCPPCPTAPRRPIPPALVALVVLLLASVALAACGFGADDPMAQVQVDPAGALESGPSGPPPTWEGRDEVLAGMAEVEESGRVPILDAAPESCLALTGALVLVADESWQQATLLGGEVASAARELLDERLAFVPVELHSEVEWYADEHVALFARYADTIASAGGTEAPREVQIDAATDYREGAATLTVGMPDLMPMATAWSDEVCFGSP